MNLILANNTDLMDEEEVDSRDKQGITGEDDSILNLTIGIDISGDVEDTVDDED